MHPLTRIAATASCRRLRDVSFDVHQGEFFGIVGRNGSGKSTLLKIMASIYRADAGRVRMAGRLAPFIELGVGFNPELTARENVVLNGVLMGLDAARGPAAAGRRDRVRRARGVRRPQAQELLVGDDGPARVRGDGPGRRRHHADRRGAGRRRRRVRPEVHGRLPRASASAGKTIVLVTHDMATVQSFCHRAMLIHDGEIKYIGDPDEAALRYYRLNFAGGADAGGRGRAASRWSTSTSGWSRRRCAMRPATAIENVEQGEPIGVDARARGGPRPGRPDLRLPRPSTTTASSCSASARTLGRRRSAAGRADPAAAGEIENRLVPGRYYLDCWVRAGRAARATWRCRRLRLLRLRRLRHRGPSTGWSRVERRRRRRARGARCSDRDDRRRSSCATSPGRRRSAAAGAGRSSCCT